jgi:quercetin dioxygenase-like cupin family protein
MNMELPQMKRNQIRKWMLRISACVAAYILLGALLDRVVFPEAEPDKGFYPRVGYVFTSKQEGFRQTILKREDGLVWLELELEPHAPGPPEHVHTSFPENFIVAEGTLSLLVNGATKRLGPGESFLIAPGTPHKPFNETDARVVVRGPLSPDFAIPDQFSVFLTQAYGFFDEAEANNRPPKALLQMSRFAPKFDSWLARPPVAVQRAVYFVIGPTARLLGYRTHYDKYKPLN